MVNSSGEELAGTELEERFRILEKKVLQAIDKIKSLEREKAEQQIALETLQERVHTLQNQLDAAQEEALEAEAWKAQVQELTQMKKRVAEKVEDLVRKIETLPFLNRE